MPYTLVHPGFSAWIKNKWLPGLSWNGLIFGSIVPDFDILFRFKEARFHLINAGFVDILFLLLPMTIVLSLIFHTMTRNTLIHTLPLSLFNKLQPYTSFNYISFLKNNYGVEIVSILIAILVHYFLDFISHWNAWYFMMGFQILIYPSTILKPYLYYFGWYFPQIIATGIGIYFVYKFYLKNHISYSSIREMIFNMSGKTKFFICLFIANVILFAALKMFLYGVKDVGLEWHYVIISVTSGLIFSFFTTPILLNVFFRIRKNLVKS